MNESVFMQVTMDAGLRASFQQAAARERRPATQVLQALMREYVARHSGQGRRWTLRARTGIWTRWRTGSRGGTAVRLAQGERGTVAKVPGNTGITRQCAGLCDASGLDVPHTLNVIYVQRSAGSCLFA